jgi:cytochrome c oxidase subunit 2
LNASAGCSSWTVAAVKPQILTRMEIMIRLMRLVSFVIVGGVGVLAQDVGSDAGEIKMTAKKYEFSPNMIRVKKGDHVRLVITALDRDHGFKIDAFKIDRNLPKGVAVTVDFTADRPGTFQFQCSEFCGLGHKKMKGELIVE